MWKNWLNGILGLWVVIIPFLNFSLAWQRTVLIFSGIVVAILGFWSFYEFRSRRPPVDEQVLNETIRPLMPVRPPAPSAQADGGRAADAPEEKKIEI